MVITDMAAFRFAKETGCMYLWGYYPGISPDKVADAVGFPLETQQSKALTPPSPDELRLLREKIDPFGLIMKKR